MSFLNYLAALAIITVFTGIIYVTVQQLYRANANDPQVQLAHDLANNLQRGKPIDSILLPDTIDLAQSLGVFIVFYDTEGKRVRSSGFLDGQPAQIPKGLFDVTKTHGEHRVTWQPRSGVRMAMVIVALNSPSVAYVVAGRSLKEVEERVSNMVRMLIIVWIVCTIILSINYGLYFVNNRNR